LVGHWSKILTVSVISAILFFGGVPFAYADPPADFGDWTITASCTLTNTATAAGNVIVESGVLTIPDGFTLDIDFTTKNLTVKAGGGVLVQSGGKIS